MSVKIVKFIFVITFIILIFLGPGEKFCYSQKSSDSSKNRKDAIFDVIIKFDFEINSFLVIKIQDENSNNPREICVDSNKLVEAVRIEKGITKEQAENYLIAEKNRTIKFANQTSLKSLNVALYSEKEFLIFSKLKCVKYITDLVSRCKLSKIEIVKKSNNIGQLEFLKNCEQNFHVFKETLKIKQNRVLSCNLNLEKKEKIMLIHFLLNNGLFVEESEPNILFVSCFQKFNEIFSKYIHK